MLTRLSRDDGFTLLEVLIATLLLASIAAGIAHVIVIVLASNRDTHEQSVATLLAVQKLEELKGAAWGSPAMATSSGDTLGSETTGYSDSPGGFVRRWSVRPIALGPPGVVLRVLVTPQRYATRATLTTGLADSVVMLTAMRTMR